MVGFGVAGYALVQVMLVGVFVVTLELPMNPNWVEAPAASAPLYATLLALTPEPVCVRLVLQNCDTVCPFANDQVTVHPLIGAVPVFVTVTWAWNPPDHCVETAYAALHPPPPLLCVGLTDGDTLRDGDADGDTLRDGDADGDALREGDADGEEVRVGEADGDEVGEAVGEDDEPLPTPVTSPLPPSNTTSEHP
jgi:hypothetical protein